MNTDNISDFIDAANSRANTNAADKYSKQPTAAQATQITELTELLQQWSQYSVTNPLHYHQLVQIDEQIKTVAGKMANTIGEVVERLFYDYGYKPMAQTVAAMKAEAAADAEADKQYQAEQAEYNAEVTEARKQIAEAEKALEAAQKRLRYASQPSAPVSAGVYENRGSFMAFIESGIEPLAADTTNEQFVQYYESLKSYRAHPDVKAFLKQNEQRVERIRRDGLNDQLLKLEEQAGYKMDSDSISIRRQNNTASLTDQVSELESVLNRMAA